MRGLRITIEKDQKIYIKHRNTDDILILQAIKGKNEILQLAFQGIEYSVQRKNIKEIKCINSEPLKKDS